MLMELADCLEAKRVRLVLTHICSEVAAFLLRMGVLSTPEPDNSRDLALKTVRHVRLSAQQFVDAADVWILAWLTYGNAFL
jgi:hypothetical protein